MSLLDDSANNLPNKPWHRLLDAMFSPTHPPVKPGSDLGICIRIRRFFSSVTPRGFGGLDSSRASWRDLCQTKWESVCAGLDRTQLSCLRQVAPLLLKAPHMRSASDNTEISLAMRQLARAGFGFATGSEKLTNLKFSSA